LCFGILQNRYVTDVDNPWPSNSTRAGLYGVPEFLIEILRTAANIIAIMPSRFRIVIRLKFLAGVPQLFPDSQA
jgi:hypothetical protein